MSRSAPNINRFWADLIIEELVRLGVQHFFIAPGSRSSPLVAAVAQHPTADATIHFDERGAAFAAVGFGRATRKPAAWITTSGTAAANGLPAVVESAQSMIPMIVLTADRPPELRDTGANQAIDQIRLFGSYARWFFDLPCPSPAIDPAFVLTTVDQAVHRALDAPSGAVHLNCPYREPLAPSGDGSNIPLAPDRWIADDRPYTEYHAPSRLPDESAVSELIDEMQRAKRGLIVVGELPTREDAQAVSALAARIGWPVIADITSQSRLGDTSPFFVQSPHFTCAALGGRIEPDMVLRFGGAVSSKDVQRFADNAAAPIVAVHNHPVRKDPGHSLSRVIRASTQTLCEALEIANSGSDPEWLSVWTETGSRIFAALQDRIDSMAAVSEPGAASILTRQLPEDHALFVASSMPIRDIDMFGSSKGALRRVAANRGASGIDGTIASAAGYQLGLNSPVSLLIGDLAVLHDLNSLSLLRERPVVVVAVNNRGGGIFSFLPIADHSDVFEPWFTAPHDWSFKHAAGMFGIDYERPATAQEFADCYAASVRSDRAALIEIVTDRRENRDLHAELRSLALEVPKPVGD